MGSSNNLQCSGDEAVSGPWTLAFASHSHGILRLDSHAEEYRLGGGFWLISLWMLELIANEVMHFTSSCHVMCRRM